MRRAWLRIGIAAAVFAAAVVTGFGAATRLAPERLRGHLEAQLRQDLGHPVSIGAVRLDRTSAASLTVTLERVRVGAPGDRTWGRIPEAEVGLDPLALATGRLQVARLELHHPVIRLVLPPRPGEAEEGRSASSTAPEGSTASALPGAARRLAEWLGGPLPFRRLRVREGRAILVGAAPDDEPVVVEALEAQLDARRLRLGRTATVEGRFRTPSGPAPLALALETRGGALAGTASAADLPLDALEPLWPWLGLEAAAGVLDLQLEWTWAPEKRRALLLASGRDLSLRPGPEGTARLALAAPRLRAELSVRDDGVQLAFAELSDGPLRLRARGRAGLPLGPDTPLRLHLETSEHPLRGGGSLLAHLPGAWRRRVEAALEPVERARIAEATLDIQGTVARLRAIGAGARPRPGELRFAVAVREAQVRAGEADRLEALAGRFAWDGDGLEASAVTARFRGRSLPRLDLVVRGLAHVEDLDELHCIQPGPAPALPGLPRLVAWLRAEAADPGEGPAFEGVAVRADWLAHPALVCSIEQLDGQIVPAEEGLAFEVERAVFAGLALRGRGRWREPDDGDAGPARLRLALDVGPPYEPMAPHPPRVPWARGRFRAGLRRLGPWRLSGADGAFALSGASLDLHDVALGLDPAGPVRARVVLDLGGPSALPYHAAFAMEELPAAKVARAGGIAGSGFSGTLHGAGAVHGDLVPGRSLLAEAEGTLVLHARQGRVHRRLPPLLAITAASGSVNPFAERELPFTAIDLAAFLEGGRLRSDHFTFAGPTVRMAASGAVAVEAPHDVEVVVGLFLFPGLDALLGRLPLLNRVLLGPNDNLVGAYFSLEGPFGEPRARLIPIRSIATGPASLVLERLPRFVFGGLRALRAVIPPLRPEEAEPAPTTRADS